MKNKPASKRIYLIFVAILIIAIASLWIFIWKTCAIYQANSAETILSNTVAKLEEITGLELSSNGVPIIDENGNSVYTIRHERTAIAELVTKKTGSSIMGLALSKEVRIKPLIEHTVVVFPGCSAIAEKKAVAFATCKEYNFAEFEFLNSLLDAKKIDLFALEYNVDWVFDVSQIKPSEGSVLCDEGNNKYFVIPKCADEEAGKIYNASKDFIEKYSAYIAHEKPFETLQQAISANVPMAKRLAKFRTSLFTKHEYSEIKNLKMTDAFALNDNLAIVNAKYDFNVLYSSELVTQKTELGLVLQKDKSGIWKISEMTNNILINLGEFKDIMK